MQSKKFSIENVTLMNLFDEDDVLEFGGCSRNRDRDKDRDRDRDNSDIIGEVPVNIEEIAFDALDKKDFIQN